MSDDLIPTISVLVIGLAAFLSQRGFSGRELRLLFLAFVAHAASAFAQIQITSIVYGSGDMTGYFQTGSDIAKVMDADFSAMFPEVVRLFFQLESRFPFFVTGEGHSTGSMGAISGLLFYVLSNSSYASCMAVGMTAFFGSVLLYRATREAFPRHLHQRLLLAGLLVPSLVFWTSGLLKESVVFGPLCLMVFGFHLVLQRRYTLGLASIGAGAVIVGLLKPYILFPFALAASAALYVHVASLRSRGRFRLRLRPAHLLVAGILALASVVALGIAFPRFATDQLDQAVGAQQELGDTVGGGSYYRLGGATESGASSQLAFAPLALATTLYRPMLFEAGNATMLVNSLETLVFALLTFVVWSRRSLSAIWHSTTASPLLTFFAVFVLTMGTAIGLSSTNLGTLSRYRAPLIPFFAIFLVVQASRRPAEAVRDN